MIPMRLAQFPRFLQQISKRTLLLRQPLNNLPTFHLCFFCCQSYFRYLYCSLDSLVRHATFIPFKVTIFNDAEQPISSAQIDAIKKLIPEANVILWPKSIGWGEDQIESIWNAYALAAKNAKEADFVVRVDADVFFFNDRIFQVAARSDADLIGDGHYVDFQYIQGGCYFFRASAVRKINYMITSLGISVLTKELGVVVEDVAAYHFAQRLGLKVWMTWFMMFPDELRNTDRFTKWLQWKFSCAHFVMKNKLAMSDAYEKEILCENIPPRYRDAMNLD